MYVLTMSAETCKNSWTDKNYITKIPIAKLKDTNKKFSGLRGWEGRGKDQGRGKGTEKTEKEKETERLPFQPAPCGCLFRYQSARFQKGPVKEGAPCPLPTGLIKPGNQPVVRRLWVPDPQVGLSPMHAPVYSNLPLQLLPNGTSLGGRKIKVRILGRSDLQPTTRYEV